MLPPRPGSGTASGAKQAVAADADAIADMQVADVAALERARAAVVEPDVDAIADDRLADVALDVVAGDRATGCAEAGHRGAAEPMAELVADDRTGAAALGPLRDRIDPIDRAERRARRGRTLRDARIARRHWRRF